jgi:hypothetical protein
MSLEDPLDRGSIDWPDSFKTGLISWIEANPPVLPIGQIFGFAAFVATPAVVATGSAETTTSAFPVNLATTGPQLLDLPDGKYIVRFGAKLHTSVAGTNAVMGVSINGAAATGTDVAVNGNVNDVSAVYEFITSLTAGSNTLLTKYGTDGGAATVTYNNRFLIAEKYANL